jgi:hypothetical protein
MEAYSVFIKFPCRILCRRVELETIYDPNLLSSAGLSYIISSFHMSTKYIGFPQRALLFVIQETINASSGEVTERL